MKKVLFALILASFLFTGFRCTLFPEKKVQEAMKPVNLVYYRMYDEEDSFADIISAYKAIHPNVSITYKKFKPEEFEEKLIEDWAKDKGADIFSISITWLGKYQEFIIPMPEKITLPYPVLKGTIKKEVVVEIRTKPSLSLRELKYNFTDDVFENVVIDNKIYGLPLSLDSLVLYYNRDLLNLAKIPEPAKNWFDFKEQVKKLTILDKEGDILQSGVGMGTSDNVSKYFDLLSLLMMQNGATMKRNKATALNEPSLLVKDYFPGEEALIFYTDFANPAKEVYSWNEEMSNDLEAFIQGKTAFFFGYSYHLPIIQAQAPKLNFGISTIPQVDEERPKNYANYFIETVSKKTKYLNEAWDFIQFVTSKEQAIKHLSKAKKPTALRGLISEQLKDFDLFPFASQILTAQSWYQGKDFKAVENVFKEMIDQMHEGALLPKEIINKAVMKINQTY